MEALNQISQLEQNILKIQTIIQDATNMLASLSSIKDNLSSEIEKAASEEMKNRNTIEQLSQQVYSLEEERTELLNKNDDLEEQIRVLNNRAESLADQLIHIKDTSEPGFRWISSIAQQIDFNTNCMIWAQQHNILKSVEPIEADGVTTLVVRNNLLKKGDKVSIQPVFNGKTIADRYYSIIFKYAKCLRKQFSDLIVVISSSGILENAESLNELFFAPLYSKLKKENFRYYLDKDIPDCCQSKHALVVDLRSAFHRSCEYMLHRHPDICLNYLCVFSKGLGNVSIHTNDPKKKSTPKVPNKSEKKTVNLNVITQKKLLIEQVKTLSGDRVCAESICAICNHTHMDGYMYGNLFVCKYCHSKYKKGNRHAKARLVPRGFHQ